MEYQSVFIFLVFIGLLVFVGTFRAQTVKTETQYLLANRNTKLFALVATLVMTELNTSTLIAFSSLGYKVGVWALSLAAVFLLGLFFYAVTVAKKWKRFNGISVVSYFAERYDKNIGYIVAIILFTAMLGFSATYVKSLTLIYEPLLPHVSPWLISALLVAGVLLMTLRGGLVAIIRTDMVSFLMILIFFPVMLYCVWHLPQTAHPVVINTFSQMRHLLPVSFVISLIILTVFSYILAPWYGQKIVAAQSEKIAFSAVMIAALVIAVLYGIGILTTAVLKSKGVVVGNAQLAIPEIVRYDVPAFFRGLGYAVLFSVSATTLAGVWSAMVTLIIGHRSIQPQRGSFHRGLLLTIIIAVAAYVLANVFVHQILNKMILANIPIVALSFALLGGFYWKKTSKLGVYLSIFVGIVCGVGSYWCFGVQGLYTWYWAVYGIPLIFLAGIVGSLLKPMSKQVCEANNSVALN